jgi:glycosyltransferase involved in cell wall biosynthesis
MADKRALILATRFPYPAFGGDKIALLNFAGALTGYRLTLLSFCNNLREMELEVKGGIFDEVHRVYLPKAQSYFNSLRALFGRRPLQLAYYESAAFRRKLDELLPQNDIVIAHLIRTGQYFERCQADVPRVLLMSDAISMAYTRMLDHSGAPPLWRVIYRLERRRLFEYEKRCALSFQQTWLHSEIDRRFLDLDPGLVKILPVGVHLEDFPYNPKRSGNVIGFVGNMSSSLNLDAAQYFVRKVFPALRDRHGMRFRIIGACPPSVKRELQRHRQVEVTGAVPRISDAMQDVFCGICPIRGGAGIQNKILNYFALGVPCVSSEVGAAGIKARPGTDFLVYKDATQAVDLIVKLHGDESLRTRIAENGRRVVEESHNWIHIQRSIRGEVEELLAERSAFVGEV